MKSVPVLMAAGNLPENACLNETGLLMQSRPKIPDFDTLMHMYQQDPEGYETFRRHLLAEAAAECPENHRGNLEHTLMRIEIARQSASTPLEAAQYAMSLMRDSVEELDAAINQLHQELANLQSLLVIQRIISASHDLPPNR